jgi:hypothetical protein
LSDRDTRRGGRILLAPTQVIVALDAEPAALQEGDTRSDAPHDVEERRLVHEGTVYGARAPRIQDRADRMLAAPRPHPAASLANLDS